MARQEKEIAVKVQGLTKTFRIPLEHSSGIKQKLINSLKGKKGYREFTPLKNISFEIEKGDFFGIVGRNGSGKSTLLKSIANIYTPTKGAVTVNGSLIPFIELGVGFNPDLTGRENIFLNGALLGFSRKEMLEMYDEIVEFAEIGDFMEEKLKNYSSGMQVRLAFSIAIKAQGDILLLDEVLAVGDEAFQRKCFEYFAKLKKEKRTVILVTHDMNSVARFCNKAMLIHEGNILAFGDIKKVVRGYETLNQPGSEKPATQKVKKGEVNPHALVAASLNGTSGRLVQITNNDDLEFILNVKPTIRLEDVFLGFTIQKTSGEYVYWYTTESEQDRLGVIEPGSSTKIRLRIQNIFGNGDYTVNVNIKKNDRSKEYVMVHDAVTFRVSSRQHLNGWMYHPATHVEVTTK